MSAVKKLTTAALIYIGYQLLTKKKYSGLCNELIEDYHKVKPTLIDTLDDLSLYLTVPTDVGNEHSRIKIEKEIEKIKQKIENIDASKAAEKASNITLSSLDVVVDTISTLKKKSSKK